MDQGRFSRKESASKIRFSVVIPTYNEAETIKSVIDETQAVIREMQEDGRIIIVDDNSPDGTGKIAEDISEQYPNVEVIHRRNKMGIGSAILTGIKEALERHCSQYVIQMDADLSHPPKMVSPIIKALVGGIHVAVASRYVEEGGVENWPWTRKVISGTANTFARWILGLKVRDATAGFKGYTEDAARFLVSSGVGSRGYAYQVETLYTLSKAGFEIVEIPYIFVERRAGRSKLGIRQIGSFVIDLLTLRFFESD